MKKLLPLLFTLFCLHLITAQVGINTTNPVTTLDVNGSVSFREGPEIVLLTGINRDISLSENKFSNYRIVGPTSSFSISGFIPETETEGQLLTIINTSNAPMTIVHNNFPYCKPYFLSGRKKFTDPGTIRCNYFSIQQNN